MKQTVSVTSGEHPSELWERFDVENSQNSIVLLSDDSKRLETVLFSDDWDIHPFVTITLADNGELQTGTFKTGHYFWDNLTIDSPDELPQYFLENPDINDIQEDDCGHGGTFIYNGKRYGFHLWFSDECAEE